MTRSDISCGRVFGCVDDIQAASDVSGDSGFHFICCCVGHPRCKYVPGAEGPLPDIERPDLLFACEEWTKRIVSMVPDWVNVDSGDASLRRISEKTLHDELFYASYLSLTVVMMRLGPDHVNLARIVNDFVHLPTFPAVWLVVPACDSGNSSGGDDGSDVVDTWEWWNSFRSLVDNHKKVNVVLEVTPDLPSAQSVERWMGEPVRCLLFNTSVFISTEDGRPVLSRPHQLFAQKLFSLDVQSMISGDVFIDGGAGSYLDYLNWLWKGQPELDVYARFARGYEDYLQVPLQPLSDHLESQIYETFEKDPIKYEKYEEAAELAIADKKRENSEDYVITVMVLGAGRGPLVTAVVNAAAKTNAKVHVYAVEKNPNAIVTLKHLLKTAWCEKDVEVVHTDMRKWQPAQKADIVVSELLGSFADNELSPECLEGAAHLLKPDAVSIPQSYSSYIAPLQSERLFTQIKDFVNKNSSRNEVFDTAYVVRAHNRYEIDKAKPVFTFEHPDPDFKSQRYAEIKFKASLNTVVHGLLGFFDAKLYKDVMISTVPATHSPGMFSWFPILFPIREPIHVPAGKEILVHFWRLKDDTKLWYEWCLSRPQATAIQNGNGSSYKMMLF